MTPACGDLAKCLCWASVFDMWIQHVDYAQTWWLSFGILNLFGTVTQIGSHMSMTKGLSLTTWWTRASSPANLWWCLCSSPPSCPCACMCSKNLTPCHAPTFHDVHSNRRNYQCAPATHSWSGMRSYESRASALGIGTELLIHVFADASLFWADIRCMICCFFQNIPLVSTMLLPAESRPWSDHGPIQRGCPCAQSPLASCWSLMVPALQATICTNNSFHFIASGVASRATNPWQVHLGLASNSLHMPSVMPICFGILL